MSLVHRKRDEPGAPSLTSGPSVDYADDRYSWAQEQIALLRAGRFSEVDVQNLIEELDEVSGSEYDKLESALAVVLLHLLKWDHQPERRSRSWVMSIREHRRCVERQLRNPGLKPRLGEAVEEAYEYARVRCEKETSVETDSLPWSCPYDQDEILTRDITLPLDRSVR